MKSTKIISYNYAGEIESWITDTGLYHREDGPAVTNTYGSQYWFYEGKQIQCSSQEEFERLLKLKAFW
jgi:hypothetical protein